MKKRFTIEWIKPKVGVGRFTFYLEKDQYHIANEYMSKNFIKEIMNEFIDRAILDDPEPKNNTCVDIV